MGKKFWLLLLLFPLTTYGQMGYGGGGMGGMGRGGGMGQQSTPPDARSMANICRISGRVMDSAGNLLKDVTLILQQQDNDPNPMAQGDDDKKEDPYYKEMTTKKNGKFNFSSLPFYHEYKLTIMADGFKRWEQDIRFLPKKNQKQIPFEQMKPDSTGYKPPPKPKGPATDKDLGDVILTPLPAKP